MKLFNAIQITALLTAGPILLNLLHAATFTYAVPLFWLSVVIYAVLFVWNVFMVTDAISGN